MRTLFSAASACLACLACVAVAGCGKKGPPLPPLVRLPVAPAEFAAERRGASVDLQFVVPLANTDNTRPANISRVDVYAVTSSDPFSDDQIVKQGTKVASVAVKAPKDPNKTIDEDESAADMEAPEGQGLDQGTIARVSETLAADALVAIHPKLDRNAKAPEVATVDGPLLPPSGPPPTRTYVAFGVAKNDKKGPPSRRILVPLVPPPAAPQAPTILYDEKAIAVAWDPVTPAGGVQRATAQGELPSRAIGVRPATIAYNVYDAGAKPAPVKLTTTAIAEPAFSDSRIVWGEERCYVVRAVSTLGDLKIESDAAAPVCTTLKDTFPPAAPGNLAASPTEGAISLIWDANTEKDLAGYIVLRAIGDGPLQPMMSDPIQDTVFRDVVAAGVRFTYVVKAVDRAGNQSLPSKPVEETARD